MNATTTPANQDAPPKPESEATLAAPSGSAWRNPETDPPTTTGKILVWIRGNGPAIVNVEERWMSYWDGDDETTPADPDEWEAWADINTPNNILGRTAAKDGGASEVDKGT